ncbi:hypothetical protein NGRA_3222, partial [Nosema granulosis]
MSFTKEIPSGDHIERIGESIRDRQLIGVRNCRLTAVKKLKKCIAKSYKRKDTLCLWFKFFSRLIKRKDGSNRLCGMRQQFLRNRGLRLTIKILDRYVLVSTKGNEHMVQEDIFKKFRKSGMNIRVFKSHRVYSRYGVKMVFFVHRESLKEFEKVCAKEKWRICPPKKKSSVRSTLPIKLDKVSTLNINHLKNKKLDLEVLLKKENPLVLCVQETWVDEGFEPRFGGFSEFHQAAKSRSLPGLCTLVRRGEGIRSCFLKSYDNILITSMDVFTESGWIRICLFNIYVPNGKRDRDLVMFKVCDEVSKMKLSSRFEEIVLLGDFNMTSRSLKKYLGNVGIHVEIKNNRIKGSRLYASGLLSSRIIDHIVRVNTQDGQKCSISKSWRISDHLLVSRKMKFGRLEVRDSMVFDRKKLLESSRLSEKFEKYLNGKDLNGLSIQDMLMSMCKRFRVSRRKKVVLRSRFSRKFERLYKKHNEVVRKAIEIGNSCELSSNLEKLKRQKGIERRKIKERFACRGIKLFIEKKDREWWKWAKGYVGNSISAAAVAVMDLSGNLVYDFSEKLNVWNSHFKALSYDVVSSEVYAIK